ncbi:U-box domain-containing protein [Arachis hypogaea]|nr:U-box domain-containing protein [Arachis hypogaea]
MKIQRDRVKEEHQLALDHKSSLESHIASSELMIKEYEQKIIAEYIWIGGSGLENRIVLFFNCSLFSPLLQGAIFSEASEGKNRGTIIEETQSVP